MTEATGPGCIHLGIDNVHKVGTIGRAGFDWEYKIVDGENNTMAAGEKGELLIKGPGVMKQYYNNVEATDEIFVNGWLKTGDVAMVDEAGFVILVDRQKDVIISGGENIYPAQVEDFFMKHNDIQDAAIIGYPNERLGEVPIAIIKIKEKRNLTKEDLFEFSKVLPKYKRPIDFFFDDVPRNPTGKIEKTKLRIKYLKKCECVLSKN